ncbi:hypothetical protein [Quadrisphaera granulorum]|nr:hypothetical protein [Quadrisphaera granulorum]
MPYTLTSAATLGYDLVRLPGGRQAAGVVVAALRSGPSEWGLLAAHHPLRTSDPSSDPLSAADDAASARELAEQAPKLSEMNPVATAPAEGPTGEQVRLAALAEHLRSSMVGSAASLERLIREQALDPADPSWPTDHPDGPDGAALDRALAADVLADAAVAAYAARQLPRLLRRRLSEPYERAVAGAVPGTFDVAPDPAVPWGPALSELLVSLRELDAAGRQRWRRAVEAGRAHGRGAAGAGAEQRSWTLAMHDACWAAHTSGRIEAAAAAQMLAVQAFLDGGFTPDDGATGAWNAVAGCVQAALVGDLLGEESLEVLSRPWTVVTGQAPVGR